MKVNELRTILKERKKDELAYLIVEMYKQIPKKVREGKELDELIQDPDAFKKARKGTKQYVKNLDFASVEREVRSFIKNAREQNYIAPNRIIPKKERSNWRFTAKRLIEQVMEISNQDKHAKVSTSLMEDLYKLFCYASGHYVFASDEPFYTIKIPQPEFLKRVVMMKKRVDEPKKWIPESLSLMLDYDLDPVEVTASLSEAFFETLDNAPLKEEVVKQADHLLQKKESTRRNVDDFHKTPKDYDKEFYIDHVVELIFIIQSSLGEYKEAIRYYHKHYSRHDTSEIRLYVLLQMVMRYQRVEDWIREYEKAVKKRIKPRDSLKKAYEYMKQTNEFPSYIG
ncbi:hypothetical protein [Virgibacillus dakarensis]|uniref:hypothetical protein n=1 Tax=Virgibacillus dakarensis TaxID=1917889 RepID=UPI000B44C2F4|nr:hypothetical protein [Virgibacillus dakarensis]